MADTYVYIRKPFLILPYSQKNIAVPKELMMDFDTGLMYVRSEDGTTDIELSKQSILSIVETEIEKLLDGVSEDGNTLRKIRDLITPLQQWMNTMNNPNANGVIDTLSEILDSFFDMEESAPTLMQQLNLKVDKEVGKGLSANDLTDLLLNKLNNIEYGANKYIHPDTKQCTYTSPVTSVNGVTTGDVIITKEDIGLGGVEEYANNYVHPTQKQCSDVSVTSVNSMNGVITLTKSNVGLGNVQNYGIASETEALNGVSNKYLTPFLAKQIINQYVV